MDISKLKPFLDRIDRESELYERMSKVTGERFNVFKILNLDASEVRLHSSLIGELLNPEGGHGQHDLFLRLFLQQVGISEFEADGAVVEVEKYIGSVSEEYTRGGRIDIAIKDNHGRRVFIENKIYASDQKNQLLRYHNHNKDACLLYLTLDGKEASEYSTGGLLLKGAYKCISYQDDITGWLKSCRKEAAGLPLVRETISQYINLINSLCYGSGGYVMNNEIRQLIIENPQLIKSIELCANEIQSITSEVNGIFSKLLDSHFKRLDLIDADGVKIKASWGEDGDGVHFGYKAISDDQDAGNVESVNKIKQILCEINKEFRDGGGWLGWKNPAPFTRSQRFRHLPREEIVDMYKNNELIEDMVKEIAEEESSIRNEIYNKISMNT